MARSEINGLALFGIALILILSAYLITTVRWGAEWFFIVKACEALPFLLPVIFAASGYEYFRNDRDVENGKSAYSLAPISFLNFLGSFAVAFLVASVLRDTLISHVKFGDWFVYLGEDTPISFFAIVSCLGFVAIALQLFAKGKVGQMFNGATFGMLVGAVCMYGILPSQ